MSEVPAAPDRSGGAAVGSIWWTRRAVALHATVVVLVPAFAALFWWQVQRVREGNTLSWAYVFEWPFFAGYAVYLWWKLVHEQPGRETPERPRARGRRARVPLEACGPGTTDAQAAEDEALAAYNRYLAELNASGRKKRW